MEINSKNDMPAFMDNDLEPYTLIHDIVCNWWVIILGAIAGALSGSAAFPEHFLPTMEKINGFEIRKTADDVERIAGIRQKRGEQNVR